jgi:isoleucyl-tRNA synthetase
LQQFPRVKDEFMDEQLARRWEVIWQVREEVSKALERARREKLIGLSLDAQVSGGSLSFPKSPFLPMRMSRR